MEPLILAATAIAATVMNKAFEKTGEKLGEKVVEESGKFLTSLKVKSPKTATAIELAPEQPLDYGQAVIEVNALAKVDSDLFDTLQNLTIAAREDSDPRIRQMVQIILDTLQSQQPSIQNLSKLAEKIGVLNQGVINTQNNTINL